MPMVLDHRLALHLGRVPYCGFSLFPSVAGSVLCVPLDVPAYSFLPVFSFVLLCLVFFFFSSCNHFAIPFPLYIIKCFLDENVELLVNILKTVSHRIGTFL